MAIKKCVWECGIIRLQSKSTAVCMPLSRSHTLCGVCMRVHGNSCAIACVTHSNIYTLHIYEVEWATHKTDITRKCYNNKNKPPTETNKQHTKKKNATHTTTYTHVWIVHMVPKQYEKLKYGKRQRNTIDTLRYGWIARMRYEYFFLLTTFSLYFCSWAFIITFFFWLFSRTPSSVNIIKWMHWSPIVNFFSCFFSFSLILFLFYFIIIEIILYCEWLNLRNWPSLAPPPMC